MPHSQSVQAIVRQLERALEKTNGVHYMSSGAHRTVIWKDQSIKIKDGKLLLPLSKHFREYYEIAVRYLELPLPHDFDHKIVEVYIVPRHNTKWFKALIVYKTENKTNSLKGEHVMGIDLGVDNFATVAISDGIAVIIDGRKAKSVNQWFNKERAELQSIYSKQNIKVGGAKMAILSCWMHNFLHQAAAFIIRLTKDYGFSRIAIGYNKNWKRGVNIGKRNNQNFISLPHKRFIEILKHKAVLNGVELIAVDKAYTSKADALAFEPI